MELTAASSPCAEACCASTPRRSVSALFERGFRRNRLEPLACKGNSLTGPDGLMVRFSLRLAGGLLAEIRFRASSCATLIAYCELLAELAAGRSPLAAVAITPTLLAAELLEVPAMKRDRAVLAVLAFRAALAAVGSRESQSEDAA